MASDLNWDLKYLEAVCKKQLNEPFNEVKGSKWPTICIGISNANVVTNKYCVSYCDLKNDFYCKRLYEPALMWCFPKTNEPQLKSIKWTFLYSTGLLNQTQHCRGWFFNVTSIYNMLWFHPLLLPVAWLSWYPLKQFNVKQLNNSYPLNVQSVNVPTW